MTGTITSLRAWKRPPVLLKDPRWRWTILLGSTIYLVLAISSVEVNWFRVYEGLERGWRVIQGFLTPDFSSRWQDIQAGLIESLTMTLTATVTGVLISVPIGIGAARNLAPAPVYMFCRSIITLSGSFQ